MRMKRNVRKIWAVVLAAALCPAVWLPVAAETPALVTGTEEIDPEGIGDAVLTAVEPDEAVDNEVINLGITANAACLMEASTGTVIYAINENEEVSPASITKIMTLILIFDALADGRLTLEETVTTSAYAASMGGSQVFLEEGESQTVDTMIKCIVVASANDASVAMAERIAGSESEFVRQMNERAAALGMTHTNFEDCCGLTDSDNHYTSAMDVALMSRELITRYPQIRDYTTIWMDTIVHVTKRGESEFGLANTNKLLKQYEYCTGLKTGSTSKAKYCVSATAEKNGIEMIGVIMGAPDYKVRFPEAKTLLEYGYSICSLYEDTSPPQLEPVEIIDGKLSEINCQYEDSFRYLSTNGEQVNEETVTKEIVYYDGLTAPIAAGEEVGKLYYKIGERVIGEVSVLAQDSVEKAGYFDYLKRLWNCFLM